MVNNITLQPGDTVSVFSHTLVGGKEIWRDWIITDEETPRQDHNGRHLFTAKTKDGILGPCPMGIHPTHIKKIDN